MPQFDQWAISLSVVVENRFLVFRPKELASLCLVIFYKVFLVSYACWSTTPHTLVKHLICGLGILARWCLLLDWIYFSSCASEGVRNWVRILLKEKFSFLGPLEGLQFWSNEAFGFGGRLFHLPNPVVRLPINDWSAVRCARSWPLRREFFRLVRHFVQMTVLLNHFFGSRPWSFQRSERRTSWSCDSRAKRLKRSCGFVFGQDSVPTSQTSYCCCHLIAHAFLWIFLLIIIRRAHLAY